MSGKLLTLLNGVLAIWRIKTVINSKCITERHKRGLPVVAILIPRLSKDTMNMWIYGSLE